MLLEHFILEVPNSREMVPPLTLTFSNFIDGFRCFSGHNRLDQLDRPRLDPFSNNKKFEEVYKGVPSLFNRLKSNL